MEAFAFDGTGESGSYRAVRKPTRGGRSSYLATEAPSVTDKPLRETSYLGGDVFRVIDRAAASELAACRGECKRKNNRNKGGIFLIWHSAGNGASWGAVGFRTGFRAMKTHKRRTRTQEHPCSRKISVPRLLFGWSFVFLKKAMEVPRLFFLTFIYFLKEDRISIESLPVRKTDRRGVVLMLLGWKFEWKAPYLDPRFGKGGGKTLSTFSTRYTGTRFASTHSCETTTHRE